MAKKREEKSILKATESVPPPAYSGRENGGFEYDDQNHHIQAPQRIESKSRKPYSRSTDWKSKRAVESRPKHQTGKSRKNIQSICLCTASVFPHYHGETIIDDNVYDEILIIDPKELQATPNKDVRLKGQCLRICKLTVLIFIILAGLACGLYGVTHYFIINKPGEALMKNGDVKLLKYSTYFCEQITTEHADIERNLMVLQKTKGQVASFNYNITKQLELTPGKDTYEYSFYAIEQGVMRITISSQEDVDVLIFDEKSKLDAWKANKNYVAYNFKRTCCKSIIVGRGVYTFTTQQDKQAFFVVHNPGFFKANTSLTLSFERSFIDHKRSNEKCSAMQAKQCSVSLPFASASKVVVEVPRTSKVFDSRKIVWKCEARVWFYVLVFAGIWLLIVIIMCISYCIFKYCFCDPCCCCCCYIVPQEKQSSKIVQYHRDTSRRSTDHGFRPTTPRGPRAQHMRQIDRQDSNESIIKQGYTTSDTSDTEERGLAKARRLSSTNSTATTRSAVSTQLSRRRSSMSSIGSDIKRGMYVDDSYEELPTLERKREKKQSVGKPSRDNGMIIIDMEDIPDGYVSQARIRRAKKEQERRKKQLANNEMTEDKDLSDTEIRLRRKRAQFSDSEEEVDDNISYEAVQSQQGYATKQDTDDDDDDDDDDDYDSPYDVVGFKIAEPSKATAETIDTLPLGPSGAPPSAPPKSAASMKGKPALRGVMKLDNIEFLPNGMMRRNGDVKLQKSKSDAVQRNGKIRKSSAPVTPRVIILNAQEQRQAEIYSTYQRGKKKEKNTNGMYNRTISLDSGLDSIENEKQGRPKIRPAADVKF